MNSKRTTFRSLWQNAYVEKVIGTIKRKLLDHSIPLIQLHLQCVLHEYLYDYYNTIRTHQSIGGRHRFQHLLTLQAP
ncbi:integrase core domain-containing protein [Bacillus sp. FJAT-45037]|uniref:integrase core domain-containing protein n=1 Tax=Bacillus sp. FJAT-45037 TaxID=2011007 RepID=UPI000C230310